MPSPVTENAYPITEELLNRLEIQLEAAGSSLRRMATDAPIYGSLSSIRCLLVDQQHQL